MSVYNLVKRGVVNVLPADGASPKNFTLTTPVKTASSFLTHSVKQIRASTKVNDFIVTALAADGAGPKDTPIAAVLKDASHLTSSISVDRTGSQQGATVFLLTNISVRLDWPGTLAGSDEIKASVAVIESLPARGVNIRLTTPTNVEVSWDKGTLLAGESIDVAFEVFDIENLGDDIKEILFRQKRILSFHGENVIEDLIKYDDAGNPITYRVRTFNSKANAEAATFDIPDADPLEVGELTRVGVIQDFNIETNDRLSIIMTLIKGPASNPDIT